MEGLGKVSLLGIGIDYRAIEGKDDFTTNIATNSIYIKLRGILPG